MIKGFKPLPKMQDQAPMTPAQEGLEMAINIFKAGREAGFKRANAAAPALLEACKELIDLADDGAYIDLANISATPISRKLRAAIAQAEGKE